MGSDPSFVFESPERLARCLPETDALQSINKADLFYTLMYGIQLRIPLKHAESGGKNVSGSYLKSEKLTAASYILVKCFGFVEGISFYKYNY